MGRPGITYEMVEAAAVALAAERAGGIPTLKEVRAHLGTGSPNTIHKFLRMWIENRPKPIVHSISIPEEITRALSNWVVQQATGSRADAEERSLQAQAAADELAKAGEALEAERDQVLADLVTVTTQRDQHQATADARAAEIERLLAEVERERKLAGDAQIVAAEAKLRADSQVEHLADMKNRIQALSAEVTTERAGRAAAERQAAVSAAQVAAAQSELESVRQQVINVQQDLYVERTRLEDARSAAEERAQQDQARIDQMRQEYETRLEQLRKEAGARFDQERHLVEELRGQLVKAAVEHAHLAERLAVVPGQEKN